MINDKCGRQFGKKAGLTRHLNSCKIPQSKSRKEGLAEPIKPTKNWRHNSETIQVIAILHHRQKRTTIHRYGVSIHFVICRKYSAPSTTKSQNGRRTSSTYQVELLARNLSKSQHSLLTNGTISQIWPILLWNRCL